MSNINILLVEDDRLNRELISDFLNPHGYNIINAEDGFEALEKLEDYYVDLILLDIQLPQMNGLEFIYKLKNNFLFTDIPVVALTAHAMLGDKKKFIDAGCDGYIPKPINVDVFESQVKQHLKNSEMVSVLQ
ncbi:response regulator receiver protein [Methanohalobium evestigatum Z-7303]|uniref:Response regulator receiver protein n=1 Tax=Methanohalobium evestigatum (strain ATCC BAA-1072 / DSM 3721 / NBRC 107634 / OCM 161 / Z-7303) TaxID=644295 RepID=D7E5V9_METEZ|nr:response regulator [Methanohalobium evestigatum]ADI72981.1 response regulator receiver protein [Methanohalobium evestigatum Z-7303]